MIDYGFIERLEGMSMSGYVPELDGGAIDPGVTVASGFDIGWHSAEQILRAFPPELANKLIPYCTMVGREAIIALANIPLSLSLSECSDINKYAHRSSLKMLLNDWGASTNVPFSSLSDECQTVIASVAFQYGSLSCRTPNFWNQVIIGDWWSALKNLRSFGDRFNTRRNIEADLLEKRLTEDIL